MLILNAGGQTGPLPVLILNAGGQTGPLQVLIINAGGQTGLLQVLILNAGGQTGPLQVLILRWWVKGLPWRGVSGCEGRKTPLRLRRSGVFYV
ncbi:hypothetical protein AAFA10_24200, partial [Klebsiella pneumoniae]|uniref:hypothetical protein n=3 Tax=Klebsiella pneumoniae TaxID=573 RepID=UPI00317C2D18